MTSKSTQMLNFNLKSCILDLNFNKMTVKKALKISINWMNEIKNLKKNDNENVHF